MKTEKDLYFGKEGEAALAPGKKALDVFEPLVKKLRFFWLSDSVATFSCGDEENVTWSAVTGVFISGRPEFSGLKFVMGEARESYIQTLSGKKISLNEDSKPTLQSGGVYFEFDPISGGYEGHWVSFAPHNPCKVEVIEVEKK